MSKEKKDQGAVRDENRTADVRDERFACQGTDCRNSGSAEQMYNTSCDPMRVKRDKLLTLVRCRTCAEAIATANGKLLREPGCGVYPLLRTLKKLEENEAVQSRREDLLRWVEGLKATKKAGQEEDQRRRQAEEARATRRERVKNYALAYARSELYGSPTVAPPSPRMLGDQHGCGLPIACCRHDVPVERFISHMGEVVGICRLAAAIFTEVFQASDQDDRRFRRLLSTGDLKQAERFAARWLGENLPEDDK